MGTVTRVIRPGGALLLEGQTIELIAGGNEEAGKDGNFRTIIVSGKRAEQKRISGVWTNLKTLS